MPDPVVLSPEDEAYLNTLRLPPAGVAKVRAALEAAAARNKAANEQYYEDTTVIRAEDDGAYAAQSDVPVRKPAYTTSVPGIDPPIAPLSPPKSDPLPSVYDRQSAIEGMRRSQMAKAGQHGKYGEEQIDAAQEGVSRAMAPRTGEWGSPPAVMPAQQPAEEVGGWRGLWEAMKPQPLESEADAAARQAQERLGAADLKELQRRYPRPARDEIVDTPRGSRAVHIPSELEDYLESLKSSMTPEEHRAYMEHLYGPGPSLFNNSASSPSRVHETLLGAGMRDLFMLETALSTGARRALTYEVDENGAPVNPDDMAYQIANIGSRIPAAMGLSDFPARKSFAYMPLPFQASRRKEAEDYSTQVLADIREGRMYATDFLAMPEYVDEVGETAATAAGLVASVATPIFPPVFKVAKGVAKVVGAGTKAAGKGVKAAGEAATIVADIREIPRAVALGEATSRAGSYIVETGELMSTPGDVLRARVLVRKTEDVRKAFGLGTSTRIAAKDVEKTITVLSEKMAAKAAAAVADGTADGLHTTPLGTRVVEWTKLHPGNPAEVARRIEDALVHSIPAADYIFATPTRIVSKARYERALPAVQEAVERALKDIEPTAKGYAEAHEKALDTALDLYAGARSPMQWGPAADIAERNVTHSQGLLSGSWRVTARGIADALAVKPTPLVIPAGQPLVAHQLVKAIHAAAAGAIPALEAEFRATRKFGTDGIDAMLEARAGRSTIALDPVLRDYENLMTLHYQSSLTTPVVDGRNIVMEAMRATDTSVVNVEGFQRMAKYLESHFTDLKPPGAVLPFMRESDEFGTLAAWLLQRDTEAIVRQSTAKFLERYPELRVPVTNTTPPPAPAMPSMMAGAPTIDVGALWKGVDTSSLHNSALHDAWEWAMQGDGLSIAPELPGTVRKRIREMFADYADTSTIPVPDIKTSAQGKLSRAREELRQQQWQQRVADFEAKKAAYPDELAAHEAKKTAALKGLEERQAKTLSQYEEVTAKAASTAEEKAAARAVTQREARKAAATRVQETKDALSRVKERGAQLQEELAAKIAEGEAAAEAKVAAVTEQLNANLRRLQAVEDTVRGPKAKGYVTLATAEKALEDARVALPEVAAADKALQESLTIPEIRVAEAVLDEVTARVMPPIRAAEAQLAQVKVEAKARMTALMDAQLEDLKRIERAAQEAADKATNRLRSRIRANTAAQATLEKTVQSKIAKEQARQQAAAAAEQRIMDAHKAEHAARIAEAKRLRETHAARLKELSAKLAERKAPQPPVHPSAVEKTPEQIAVETAKEEARAAKRAEFEAKVREDMKGIAADGWMEEYASRIHEDLLYFYARQLGDTSSTMPQHSLATFNMRQAEFMREKLPLFMGTRDAEFLKELESGIANGALQRALSARHIRNTTGSAYAWGLIKQSWMASRRAMISGMLGGSGILGVNLRFFGNNWVTGHAIVSTSLGLEKGTGVAAHAQVLLMETVTGLKVPPETVRFKSTTGRVWTEGALLEEERIANIRNSQTTHEFQASILDQMMRANGTTKTVEEATGVRQAWRWADPTGKNYASVLAEESDVLYRRAAFREAIREGKTTEQAGEIGRRSMLDYAGLSKLETDLGVGRAILFYTFTRQMAANVLRAAVTHPNDMKRMITVQRALHEAMGDWATEQDYEKGRLWSLVKDDVMLLGPANPVVDAVTTMAAVADVLYTAIPGTPGSVGEKLKIALPKIFFSPVVDFFEKSREYGEEESSPQRVPDRYIIMAQQLGLWQGFVDAFDIEAVPEERMTAGRPTYAGRQFQFSSHAGYNKFLSTELALAKLGLLRGIKDISQTLAIAGYRGQGDLADLRYLDDGHWYLYTVGMETPVRVPSYIEKQADSIRATQKALEAGAPGKAR